MIEAKDIDGKQIKEIMNENTVVLDELKDGWDNDVIRFTSNAGTVGDITVLYTEYYVFIFDKTDLRAVFYVYEIRRVSFNKKRGVVTAVGHETMHEYWLDDGEYNCRHTR
jgi:hypothetical protein